MLRTWKKAHAIVTKLNNRHLSSSDVQYKVTECCHYYNLEKVWTHLGPSTDCTSSRSLPSQPNTGTGVFSEDEIEGHRIETADSAPTSAISKARALHRNPWPGNEDPYHFKPCDSNKVEQDLRRRRQELEQEQQELEREQQELDRLNLEMRDIQVEKHTSNMLAEIEKAMLNTARVKTKRDLGLAEKADALTQLQLAQRKLDMKLMQRQIRPGEALGKCTDHTNTETLQYWRRVR